MQTKVAEVALRVEGLPRRRVYYALGFGEGGEFTAGGNTFVHEMIEQAGGINIAADLEGWAYSLELIVSGSPDLILCSDENGTRERLISSAGYREMEAVQQGRVYTIDTDLIDRQGPRLAEGLEALARRIHPEAFR